MPYRRRKTTIQSKATGKWRKKQTCGSIPKAKRALTLLNGLEHGLKTRKKK